MRQIDIIVTSEIVGKAILWGYPREDAADDDYGPLYDVPTYKLIVRGKDDSLKPLKREFEVIRFGVQQQTKASRARVVGLAKDQKHKIKKFLPHYAVHSADSEERGAWVVYDSFLVHDGPDNPLDKDEPFASIGCVELCGPRAFYGFNDYLISLSGAKASSPAQKLVELGKSGVITIEYQGATRPPLKPI